MKMPDLPIHLEQELNVFTAGFSFEMAFQCAPSRESNVFQVESMFTREHIDRS